MSTDKNVVRLGRGSVTCPDCRLKDLCLPCGLPEREVEELGELVRHGRLLPRGQYIYRQGDALVDVYLVKTGSVKSYFTAADGSEQVVGFHMPGDLIALEAVEHDRHGCSAVTLEHTSLCEMPYPRVEELCRRFPSLLHELLLKLGSELARDHRLRLLISQRGAEERLSVFLLELAERLGRRGFSSTELTLPMSRYDIANYLGVAAETVSRTFTRFESHGLLTVDRRYVRILDADRLRAIAGLHPPIGRRESGTSSKGR